MKVLLCGDLHIREFYRLAEIDRLSDFSLLLKRLLEIIDVYKPDVFIQLGDFFHSLSPYLHKRVINYGVDFIDEIASHVDKVFILLGNHDIYRNEPIITFLERGAISVVTEPKAYDTFFFIPFGYPNVNPPSDKFIVLFHDEIEGALYPTGMKSGGRKTIPCRFAFGGHIHLPQVLYGKIYFVGTPIQHDFGEQGIEPRVILYNSDTDEIESITLKGLPCFRVFDVYSKEDIPYINNLDYYLLRLKQKGIGLADILSNRRPRVFLEYDYVVSVDKVKTEMEELKLDVIELIDEWIDGQPISDDLIKSRVKELAREIWNYVAY